MNEFARVKKNLLMHELGHWIAAQALNFETGSIEINVKCTGPHSFGHSGSAMISPPDKRINTLNEASSYITSRIIILMSGAVSENYENGFVSDEAVNKTFDDSAKTDFIKITELLNIARLINPNEVDDIHTQLERIKSDCFEEAKNIIERNYNLIDFLSESLSKQILYTNKTYDFDVAKINTLKEEYLSKGNVQ